MSDSMAVLDYIIILLYFQILWHTSISHLISNVIPTNGRNLSLGMLRFEG